MARKMDIEANGTLCTSTLRILLYAGDIVLVGSTVGKVKGTNENLGVVVKEWHNICFSLDACKTSIDLSFETCPRRKGFKIVFTAQIDFCHSFMLETESNPGPYRD